MATNGRSKKGRNATNGFDFKLSSICINITWKHLLLHLNEQYYLFQVIEYPDLSEYKTDLGEVFITTPSSLAYSLGNHISAYRSL